VTVSSSGTVVHVVCELVSWLVSQLIGWLVTQFQFVRWQACVKRCLFRTQDKHESIMWNTEALKATEED